MELLGLSQRCESQSTAADLPTRRNVPKIDGSRVDYEHVFANHLLRNAPCVLTNLTIDWPSAKLWVRNGRPNLSYLESEYGRSSAPIADCSSVSHYGESTRANRTLSDYVTYLQNYAGNGNSSPEGILYLKDWHLKRERPNDAFYKTPKFFASDWLNEYYEGLGDDFKFVYIGPTNSWTPFHEDVIKSFSWSANICGRKKWWILPAGEEKRLMDNFKKLPGDIRTCENIDFIEIVQEPGEILFVPSGWHHQVLNLDNTISINHNWINGCNVFKTWEFLEENLALVKVELGLWAECDDANDWQPQVQKLMRSSHGMDFSIFFDFLNTIAEKRLSALSSDSQLVYEGFAFDASHLLFDLKKILEVLNAFTEHEDAKDIGLDSKINCLVAKIKDTVT